MGAFFVFSCICPKNVVPLHHNLNHNIMGTQIQSLLNLDEIIKKDNDNKVLDLKSLAESIMNEVCIFNGQYTYYPIEIEFYIYDKKNHADIHVYPREAKAGDLFFHLSGMDICFESSFEEKNGTIRFGGILIRALEREDGKRFGGPLTCVNEVLNTATEHPHTIYFEHSIRTKPIVINLGKRKGINKYEKKKDDYWDAKYRFIREGITNSIEREDETFDFGNAQVSAKKIKRKRYYKIED